MELDYSELDALQARLRRELRAQRHAAPPPVDPEPRSTEPFSEVVPLLFARVREQALEQLCVRALELPSPLQAEQAPAPPPQPREPEGAAELRARLKHLPFRTANRADAKARATVARAVHAILRAQLRAQQATHRLLRDYTPQRSAALDTVLGELATLWARLERGDSAAPPRCAVRAEQLEQLARTVREPYALRLAQLAERLRAVDPREQPAYQALVQRLAGAVDVEERRARRAAAAAERAMAGLPRAGGEHAVAVLSAWSLLS